MAFITMNPGYPGRAELPESLKALFRPVSMVLPDLALICEIMLMAEGFQMSKLLSRKFVILYKLCEDLLSKARHYNWKLQAMPCLQLHLVFMFSAHFISSAYRSCSNCS
jgi:dynein heavy chain